MILAMDTATSSCSLAVIDGDKCLAHSHVEMAKGQAEHMFPALETLLVEAGVAMGEISHIVVTKGPGSFTGVRLAVAAARAFGVALKVPVSAITTLEALALTAVGLGKCTVGDNILATEDARRGEVYTQGFTIIDAAFPLTETSSVEAIKEGPLPKQLFQEGPEHLHQKRLVVLGTGQNLITGEGVSFQKGAMIKAEASIWGKLVESILTERTTRHLKPLYIRPPDAKPQKKLWLDQQD
jgi:tRNA threonylcarbamoyl adenosine modification protein YeaZ